MALTGCGAGGLQEQQDLEADPAFVVRMLPTRPGLTPDGGTITSGSDGFDATALGQDVPELAKSTKDAGLRTAAVRRWTGPGGAQLVAIAGLWDDGEAASAIGGELARAAVPGGEAWTPSNYGGSQGFRSADARALSVVLGKVSLFVRASGPVNDKALLRTIELMRKAAAQQDLQGSGPDG